MKPIVIVGGPPEQETISLIHDIGDENGQVASEFAQLVFVDSRETAPALSERADFVVLDLENPELARISEETTSEVLWFSAKPPQNIAGPLLENFSGAYFRETTGDVVFCRGQSGLQSEELYPLEEASGAALAAICVARAAGVSPEVIRRALRK